jgi:hypothetical protein
MDINTALVPLPGDTDNNLFGSNAGSPVAAAVPDAGTADAAISTGLTDEDADGEIDPMFMKDALDAGPTAPLAAAAVCADEQSMLYSVAADPPTKHSIVLTGTPDGAHSGVVLAPALAYDRSDCLITLPNEEVVKFYLQDSLLRWIHYRAGSLQDLGSEVFPTVSDVATYNNIAYNYNKDLSSCDGGHPALQLCVTARHSYLRTQQLSWLTHTQRHGQSCRRTSTAAVSSTLAWGLSGILV